MTYESREYSVQDGSPVLRFLFVQGETEYRYTTEANFVSDSNGTFEPAPIRMSSVNQTNEMAKDPVNIDLPRDNDLALLFLGGTPEQITTVTIYRDHTDTDDQRVYWKGRVAGSSVSGDTLTLECENVFTSMRRPGVRARYQKTCRHALYQTGCNLHDYDYAIPATVTSVSGTTLTITGHEDSTNDNGHYTGGVIETADGFRRHIVYQNGNTFKIMYPMQAISDEVNGSNGQALVTLYPGCDRSRTTCIAKFNNIINFGGFPWIPNKNPFGNDVTGSVV